MSEKERAAVILLVGLVIASVFVVTVELNRIDRLEGELTKLSEDYEYRDAQYDLLYSRYLGLNDNLTDKNIQILQLSSQVNDLKEKMQEALISSLNFRAQYEEVQIENAKLRGALIISENGENIAPPQIEPKKNTFRIGDTVSFNINSSWPLYGSNFTITDPNGILVWVVDTLMNWVQDGDSWVAPYYSQTSNASPMVLEHGSTLGVWTWTYMFSDLIKIEGNFTVEHALPPSPGGIDLSELPEPGKKAVELALTRFNEILKDPWKVTVTRARNEIVEYPLDSGEMVDVWRVDVEGTGSLGSTGDTVWLGVVFYVLTDTWEVVEVSKVSSPIAYLSD